MSGAYEVFCDDKTGIVTVDDGCGNHGSAHPNIHRTGSVRAMKKHGIWKKDDRVVESHGFKYNTDIVFCSNEADRIAAEFCRCDACRERRAAGA